jgi:hypothetical protein
LRKDERIVGEDETDTATFIDLYTLPLGMNQRCAADSSMHQPVSPSRDSPGVGSPDTGEDRGRGCSARGGGSALTTVSGRLPFELIHQESLPVPEPARPSPKPKAPSPSVQHVGGDVHSRAFAGH